MLLLFLTVLVLLEGETAEGSVDDEEDGDEEGGDARRVHDGVRPRVVSRRRRRRRCCHVRVVMLQNLDKV